MKPQREGNGMPLTGFGSRRAGFTLLELIGVIGVIAILVTIGLFFMTQAREASRLREAQSQFTQAIERVRNLSRRYSRTYQFSLKTFQNNVVAFDSVPGEIIRNTITGVLEYEPIRKDPLPGDAGTLPRDAGTFPAGVRIEPITTTGKPAVRDLVFQGPFGRLVTAEPALAFCLTLENATTTPWTEVSVLGVTGKVVSRAIGQGRSDCPQ